MRSVFLVVIAAIIGVQAQAQLGFPGNNMYNTFGYGAGRNFNLNDTLSPGKWSLNKYSGLSTSFSVFNGGSATIVAAPIGLQLNRRLSNNLYAFAGVNVAPAYVNFRSGFLNNDLSNKGFSQQSMMYRPGSFGMFSRAELGLMYTNDERTFRISGSFGIERSQFPNFGGFQQNEKNRQPVIVR